MSWTDERVDLLSRLWLEGKSASQIAGLLSGGLTRNAVIGKVHRLGLAGRVKANAPALKTPEASVDAMDVAETITSVASVRRAAPRAVVAMSSPAPAVSVACTIGATALSLNSAPAEALKVVAASEEKVVPLSLKVTIVELRENMCKWPIGDPSSMEFRYCGSPARAATPYCAHHGKVAYQPAQDRRRVAERDRRPLLAR
jgi:GcrA cell cycle regulator